MAAPDLAVYGFEDRNGEPLPYTTMLESAALRHAEERKLRVVEHRFERVASEPIADHTSTRPRVLRDKWVTLRSVQHCSVCAEELCPGLEAHHVVQTMGGEFFSEYTCMRCSNRHGEG